MHQAPLPIEYQNLTSEETRERIQRAKAMLGSRLVILGHHYQRDEIIEHADFRGDSYKLCKDAQRCTDAEFIVFCGVHFMAESADILTDKRVILPNLAAGCSMADMANIFQVRKCWRELGEAMGDGRGAMPKRTQNDSGNGRENHAEMISGSMAEGSSRIAHRASRIIPVTYINSAANLKAFVGDHGGTVCTSTNAPAAVKWALEHAEKVLFFPDQHLGRNTGVKLGYDPDGDMCVWDPFKPLGGNTPETLKRAKFILWKGHCSVHQRFTVEQIEKARAEHPGVQVIVHPECPLEVVRAADCAGSTEFIIRTVTSAPPGSAWAVGTEINLVSRLANELRDRTVFCLDSQICPCSTMYRIHPSFLLWALEHLATGNVVNEIVVPDEVKQPAKIALDRMLQLA